ncbi:hypothetical protein AB9T88_10605 [Flavobacterium sp. LBUM151]
MNNRNLAFALLAFFAFAKTQAQVTFRPGIQAGINISKITDSGLDSKTDFYIGAFGALKLSKFYTLQPEITYSKQGGKGTASADELALTDVGEKRAKAYKVLSQAFFENHKEDTSKEKPTQNQLRLFLIIFNKFMHEVPADHFSVDLGSGVVKSLK